MSISGRLDREEAEPVACAPGIRRENSSHSRQDAGGVRCCAERRKSDRRRTPCGLAHSWKVKGGVADAEPLAVSWGRGRKVGSRWAVPSRSRRPRGGAEHGWVTPHRVPVSFAVNHTHARAHTHAPYLREVTGVVTGLLVAIGSLYASGHRIAHLTLLLCYI